MSTQIEVRNTKLMQAFNLDDIKEQLSNLLDGNPRKIEAFRTRILKIALNPMLANCSPVSIIKCGIQALTLNLQLEGGQGYIVNYGGEAQFDCGYKGWQVLAKRAGFSVQHDIVYQCDEFSQQGFGFDRDMTFIPNHAERKGSDDRWAKENLVGVIVSIKEDETGNKTSAFVPADMIHKIVGKSPSTQTDKGKKFSPHENWAEQMFAAKAIKQVLTKFPIDLSKAADLHKAIEIANNTESIAQQQQQVKTVTEYPHERFNQNLPIWKDKVYAGKIKVPALIAIISSKHSLNEKQLEELISLKKMEPIEVEAEQELEAANG